MDAFKQHLWHVDRMEAATQLGISDPTVVSSDGSNGRFLPAFPSVHSGGTFHEFSCRDDRVVEPPKQRRSVGAECNWGIRFRDQAEAEDFLNGLAGELCSRLTSAGRSFPAFHISSVPLQNPVLVQSLPCTMVDVQLFGQPHPAVCSHVDQCPTMEPCP